MERKFKTLIKEAILEALVEFTNGGIATTFVGDAMEDGIGSGTNSGTNSGGTGNNTGGNNTGGNSGQGGGSEDSSGGGLNNGRPIPDVGVGTWSLRK